MQLAELKNNRRFYLNGKCGGECGGEFAKMLNYAFRVLLLPVDMDSFGLTIHHKAIQG